MTIPAGSFFVRYIVTVDTILMSADNIRMSDTQTNVEESLEHREIDAQTLRMMVTGAVGDAMTDTFLHFDIGQFRSCRLAMVTMLLEFRDGGVDGERVLASSDIAYKHKAVRTRYTAKKR